MVKITIGDFCAGIGGIHLGFEQASDNFKVVYANDIDKNCKLTYDFNFPDTLLTCKNIKDIELSTIPPIDIFTAGFPCQSFSLAGNKKGFDDCRGLIFFELLRIIKYTRARCIFLENVKNLETHDNKETFKRVKKELENIGYHIHSKVMNTSKYGNIPQHRERIYIIGFLYRRDYNNFEFPAPIDRDMEIRDCLEEIVDKKYYYTKGVVYDKIKDEITSRDTLYQWRRKYVRENKSKLCPTLTANMGTGGHNVALLLDDNGIRKLTPRECLNFQGFPGWYGFPKIANSHQYKQAGNSVSVPVIERIAENIYEVLTCNAKLIFE
jgi:DNA (cytosine-5)-methyltransferase 1